MYITQFKTLWGIGRLSLNTILFYSNNIWGTVTPPHNALTQCMIHWRQQDKHTNSYTAVLFHVHRHQLFSGIFICYIFNACNDMEFLLKSKILSRVIPRIEFLIQTNEAKSKAFFR